MIDIARILQELIPQLPLSSRVFAIEYEPSSVDSGGLWCVGLKKPSTFEKEGEIEIWTNWCKSVSLEGAIELFCDALPTLVIE